MIVIYIVHYIGRNINITIFILSLHNHTLIHTPPTTLHTCTHPHSPPLCPPPLPLHTHSQCLNDICNILHNFIHYGALPIYPRFNDLGIISWFDWQQKGNKKSSQHFLGTCLLVSLV